MRLPANKHSVLAEASEAVGVFHQVGGGGNAFGGSGAIWAATSQARVMQCGVRMEPPTSDDRTLKPAGRIHGGRATT
jgi:hypothetical protein